MQMRIQNPVLAFILRFTLIAFFSGVHSSSSGQFDIKKLSLLREISKSSQQGLLKAQKALTIYISD